MTIHDPLCEADTTGRCDCPVIHRVRLALDSHDPLCRSHYRRLIPTDRCADCDLIRRVRADQ